MATCVVSVKVLKPGVRVDELIAAVADDLHIPASRQRGLEVADFWFTDVTADEAWGNTDRAIANAGPDADEYLLLWPRRNP